jgi:hypothetical protein
MKILLLIKKEEDNCCYFNIILILLFCWLLKMIACENWKPKIETSKEHLNKSFFIFSLMFRHSSILIFMRFYIFKNLLQKQHFFVGENHYLPIVTKKIFKAKEKKTSNDSF